MSFFLLPEGRGDICSGKIAIDAGFIRFLDMALIGRQVYGPDAFAVIEGNGIDIVSVDLYSAWWYIDPGCDLVVGDKDALGLYVAGTYEADDLFAGVCEAVDVALVGRRLNTKNGADIFGIILHDAPPVECLLGDGILFDQDAVLNAKLLVRLWDGHQWKFIDDVAGQLGGRPKDEAG